MSTNNFFKCIFSNGVIMLHNNITSFDYERILKFILLINEYRDNYRYYVLNCLSSMFGYQHLTFLQSDFSGNFANPVGLNISNNLCKNYEIHYNKLDIFRINGLPSNLQSKKSLSILDIMPFSDYEKTEYYNDFLKKENLYYEIAVPLKMRNSMVGGIGIFRQKEEGNFTFKDCEIINTVAGHIASNFYNITKITELKKERQVLNNISNNNILLPDKENTGYNTKLNLTRRELEIIQLVDEGLNNNEIADRLYVSFHTVKTHLERIFNKLNVNNRTAMLYKYREMQKHWNL